VLDDSRYAAEFPHQPPPDLEQVLQTLRLDRLPPLVQERRATAMVMTSFRENRIEGTMHAARDGYAVFQLPFEPGWRVFVDGTRAATVRVNSGLLAVPLPAGDHHIVLRYLPPALAIGGSISVLSILLLAFARWRWPRVLPLERA
jgi:uncharacterized membrane protein YfhO